MKKEIAKEFITLLQSMPLPREKNKNCLKQMNQLEQKSLSSAESFLDENCKHRVLESCSKINQYRVKKKRKTPWKIEHFILHEIYASASKIYWSLFNEIPELSSEQQDILDHFQKNKFHLAGQSDADSINCHLKPIYDRLAYFNQNVPANYSPKKSTRMDYTEGERLPNQVPLETLTESELLNIKSMFRETGFGDIIKNHYQSNFGAANIRAWRYLPASKSPILKPNGSGKMLSTSEQKVGVHLDAIAGFKFMMFNGDITPQHGCFDALAEPEGFKVGTEEYVNHLNNDAVPIFRAIGHNPCLMVVSNDILHRALAPASGFYRDTVEITIQPYLGDEPLYVDAGCAAGNPLNPFSDWTKRV